MKVTLYNSTSLHTIQSLVSSPSLSEASCNRLESRHDLPNERVTLLFEFRENAGSKEDFGKAYSVDSLVEVELLQHDTRG